MHAQARIYFHKEKYEVALKTFMKVLSTNPTCPPSVRLGVGFCLYRLDAIELAQKVLLLVNDVQGSLYTRHLKGFFNLMKTTLKLWYL